jgi:hypothetical protein
MMPIYIYIHMLGLVDWGLPIREERSDYKS